MSNDEERALLDAYAEATSPSPSDVERALTRTLARIDSESRPAILPDRRRRFVWVAAAGLATLVIATAAVAGVRWYQARPQPTAETYGAARLDRDAERIDARASQRGPTVVPVDAESAPDQPEPAPELQPEPVEPSETEPPSVGDERSAPRRARSKQPPAESPSDDTSTSADASQLAAESRLLALVRRALRDNDFAAALQWAQQHARQHPNGSLTEERLILEAVAACRGGQRDHGLAAAKQLREQFPNTSALAKVEQSCAGE